jgi:TonB family protein
MAEAGRRTVSESGLALRRFLRRRAALLGAAYLVLLIGGALAAPAIAPYDPLKQDPGAKGRVQLRFTVGPTGGVTRSSVKGFDPTLDACIQELVRKWRFGAPKDDDDKPTSADFQIPLILEPGN